MLPDALVETEKPTRDSELDVLREAADISRKAADNLSDQLKRLTADFEAFRRRVDREKQERFEHGREEVLLEIVGLWDNLEQALAAARAGADLKAVVTGLELIQQSF
ncbi:MAG: nucleotide exchange factor GrpE, partial [bacterium]